MASPAVTWRLRGFGSLAEWERERIEHGDRINDEWQQLAELRNGLTAQGVRGHCPVCAAESRFVCPEVDQGAQVSFRESLLCETCCSNARQRAAAAVLFDAIDPQRCTAYLTEQTSHFYLYLGLRLKKLIGSEFIASLQQRLWLTVWLARHGRLALVRREDVTALSLATASVDAVVTLDVLEHVYDYRRALAEFARILRPGGVLVITVPFYVDREQSTLLARVDAAGGIGHLQQPPEYHGDPLSGGVLCFHHFGWDLLGAIRQAGFADVEALRMRDPAQGLPETLWVIRARKA
ncbi:MAG: methyltransferase domain-containing protein [Lysobacter sp.]|nr:methyltransferase domain-containing protein [Lysobacter sp.]